MSQQNLIPKPPRRMKQPRKSALRQRIRNLEAPCTDWRPSWPAGERRGGADWRCG